MADLSSSSNLMALEGLPEHLRKDIIKNILRHCYQITEQGVQTSLTGLTGAQTGLTASSRVSQNKSKPKMVKLKNLRLVLGKQLNLKAVISIKEKKPKSNEKLSSTSQRQIMSMVLVSLKILNTQNLLLKRSSIMRIGSGVTLTN
jgi:hypothetical protein